MAIGDKSENTEPFIPNPAANHYLLKNLKTGNPMIKLTRLDGSSFILNAELIRDVEARPDTYITLIGGDRIVVAESPDEVLRRAVAYQQAKHLIPQPGISQPQSDNQSEQNK